MIATVTAVMTGYFILMVVVGYAGKKYAGTFESFLGTGRSAGIVLIVGGAMGTHIGNGFVVGGASEGAAVGLGGCLYGLGCCLSYLVVAFAISDFVYKGGYMSLKDYLQQRYGDRLTGIIYDVSTTLSYIGNVAAQLLAGKALFEVMGFDGRVGVVVIAVVVLLYSRLSGLWGTMATSVIQTAIIFFGLVFTSIYILSHGALDSIAAAYEAGRLPTTTYEWVPYSFSAALALTIPTSFSSLVDQCIFQRIYSARSARAAKWGHILAAVLMIPVAILPALIGVYGRAVYGATDTQAFFTVVTGELPALLAALVICAVVASVMSTIDSMYVAFSVTLVRDIYLGLLHREADEKKLSRLSTLVCLCVTVLCAAIAISSSSIIDLLCATYTFIGAACLTPFIGGMVWKKGNAKGAVAGSIVGVAACLADMAGLVSFTFESIIPILFAAAAYVAVSLLTATKTGA